MKIDNNGFKIHQYEVIDDELVFVDGLTRVGKSALNQLLNTVENVSHPQFIELLEQLIPLISQSEISIQAASSLLRLHLNERFYNFRIGRNLNFRFSDLTSIWNAKNPQDFFKLLSKPDGDEVLNLEKNQRIIHQFQTHDALTHFSKLKSMKLDFKMIELVRNPIDTIYSWYRRGWGERFDNADKRSFTMLFEFKDKMVPHYVHGMNEDYFKLSPIEKCVALHNHLIRKSIDEFKSLSEIDIKRLKFVSFEQMVTEPYVIMKEVADFLGSNLIENQSFYFSKARVPRKIHFNSEKRKFICSNINHNLLDELIDIEDHYAKNNYYGF